MVKLRRHYLPRPARVEVTRVEVTRVEVTMVQAARVRAVRARLTRLGPAWLRLPL
jgi:hypothetical protein